MSAINPSPLSYGWGLSQAMCSYSSGASAITRASSQIHLELIPEISLVSEPCRTSGWEFLKLPRHIPAVCKVPSTAVKFPMSGSLPGTSSETYRHKKSLFVFWLHET